jgi:hypothetical protein
VTLAGPVRWLVLRCFDNRIGLRRNLRYVRYLAHCRRRFGGSERDLDPKAREALASLRRDGLCVLDRSLPAERVAHIAARASALLADPTHQRDVPEVAGFALHLKDCPRALPELRELLGTDAVAVVEAYYRAHLKVYYAEMYRSLPTTQTAAYSWMWHTDDHPAPVLKIMVYLTEVTESSGAFRAFVRPASRELLRRGFSREKAELFEDALKDVSRLKVCEGPPGTVVIFDNNLVHRATAPRESYRDVVVFEVLPSPEPWPVHLDRLGGMRAAEQRGSDYPEDPSLD